MCVLDHESRLEHFLNSKFHYTFFENNRNEVCLFRRPLSKTVTCSSLDDTLTVGIIFAGRRQAMQSTNSGNDECSL